MTIEGLVLREEKGARLSVEEGDGNIKKLRDAIQGLTLEDVVRVLSVATVYADVSLVRKKISGATEIEASGFSLGDGNASINGGEGQLFITSGGADLSVRFRALAAVLDVEMPTLGQVKALITALGKFPKVFKCSTTISGPYNSTTVVLMGSFFIPAGTVNTGVLVFKSLIDKNGTAGSLELKLWKNSASAASGTQVARQVLGSTIQLVPFDRELTLAPGKLLRYFPSTASQVNDKVQSTARYESTAFDWDVDNYIVVSASASSAADAFSLFNMSLVYIPTV